MGPEKLRQVRAVLDYAGHRFRSGDLFGAKSVSSFLSRQLQRALKDVDNPLMRHMPMLYDTLKTLVSGKLSDKAFPFQGASNTRERLHDVVVFIQGGVTFAEVVAVERLKSETPGLNVVLGGSCVHNSRSFLEDVVRFDMETAGAAPRY